MKKEQNLNNAETQALNIPVSRFNTGDTVKTRFSCEEGTVNGVVPIWSVTSKIEDDIDKIKGYLVHVLFPENEKRCGYKLNRHQFSDKKCKSCKLCIPITKFRNTAKCVMSIGFFKPMKRGACKFYEKKSVLTDKN